MEVRKRVDEIRILESRKSSRLVDQDKDFARIADIGLSGAKATDIALAGVKSTAAALAAVASPFSASSLPVFVASAVVSAPASSTPVGVDASAETRDTHQPIDL